MFGLSFYENWYIVGKSDGSNGIPAFKLAAYKGHTLQGNYERSFVYAREPQLPKEALPAVREAAAKVGLDFDKFARIDNTCPAGKPLNDSDAGTGTSTTDCIDLVIGEGGVIDWIPPAGEVNTSRNKNGGQHVASANNTEINKTTDHLLMFQPVFIKKQIRLMVRSALLHTSAVQPSFRICFLP